MICKLRHQTLRIPRKSCKVFCVGLCILFLTVSAWAGELEEFLNAIGPSLSKLYDTTESGLQKAEAGARAGEVGAHAHTASSDACTKYCSSAAGDTTKVDRYYGPWVPYIDTVIVDSVKTGPWQDYFRSIHDGMFIVRETPARNDRWYDVWGYLDTTRHCVIGYDTARYYAKVDTCLTCPKGYDLWSADRWGAPCVALDARGEITTVSPDTAYTTRWLPKIPVYLTDEQYDKLMEMLHPPVWRVLMSWKPPVPPGSVVDSISIDSIMWETLE